MSVYDAGQAKLSILPSTDGFARKLETDLKKINAELAVRVVADTTQARDDIAQLRQLEKANNVTVRVHADTSDARREIASLRKEFDGSKALSALKLNVGALGVGSLPAIATALTTVAGAAQQVAQAGLVLPGMFAGIASSAAVVKLGTAGVADAFTAVQKSADGTEASIKAANQALAGLAPSAREAVLAASQLKDELKQSLQLPVQDNLFRGLAEDARKLVASDLPVLQKGLTGIATGLNSNLHQLMTTLGSDSSKGLLDRILGNTGDAQARLSKAIDPLVHAMGTLAAAGTDTLPRLADGVGTLADRFDHFITAADQDGRLAKWIDEGITGFDHIGNTLLNVGKSFTAITQAAGGGGGLLSILDQGSEKLATFLNSTEGQDKLSKFFAEGREQLAQWAPILSNIVGILPSLLEASRAWTDALLPPLRDITGFLKDNPELVQQFATAFIAWKTIDGVTDLLGSLGKVSTLLSTALPGAAATGAAGMTTALAPVLAAIATIELFANTDFGKVREVYSNTPGGPQGIRNPLHGKSFDAPNAPTKAEQNHDQATHTTGPRSSYQAGGPIVGGVAGRDSVPIMAMPGEHMLTTGDVAAMGGHANVYAFRRALHGYAGGGEIIDPYGNPFTPGPAPGGPAPVAPPPDQAGVGLPGILGSLVSGVQGPLGNLLNFTSGAANQATGTDVTPGLQTQHGSGTIVPEGYSPNQPASLADRAATLPGLWGLLGSAFSSDPATNIAAWGEQTGQWLGNFTARTVGSFATSLYKTGLLGFFGLQNSILSPDNPWNQAGQSIGQFAFSSDGPLGVLLGANDGPGAAGSTTSTAAKGPTAKQLREAGQKIDRADQRVALIQQRIAELPADAKDSQRQSLANQLANAQQDAADARTDLAGLQNGQTRSSTTTPSVATPAGLSGNKATVYQAMLNAGFPASEWSALQNLLNGESGFNSAAQNPSSTAFGLFQFLDSTWSTVGASKTSDPAAQAVAGLAYIRQRYGTPSKAWAFWQAQSPHWYDTGFNAGPVPKGLSLVMNGTGGNEHMMIMTPQQHALASAAINPTPPRPNFTPGPGIGQINPAPPRAAAVIPTAPTTPLPGPVQAPTAPAPVVPPPEQPQQPTQQQQPYQGPAQVAPAPGDLNHNLAAINTGIASTAATVGNIAATAASTAASAASFGAAGAGGGGLGSLIAGGIQEVGKIATDATNVASSFLVGNVTAGTTPNAYGELNIAPQNVPVTAPDNRRTYNMYGVDSRNIVDGIRLKDAQDMQAQLSNF